MRKALLFLILLVLSPISMAEEKAPSDTRLLQPVTIESTGKRLHSVVDEISKATGVTIRCGNNSKDWQVRDIPVAVCAHELPLGVLLQSLADCTHLHLSNEGSSYRLWRDQKGQQKLDDYAKTLEDFRLAEVRWNWDMVAQLKDIPRAALSCPPHLISDMNKDLSLSALIGALGPDFRDRAMAGEVVIFDTSTAGEPLKSLLTAYVEAAILNAGYSSDRISERGSTLRFDMGPGSEIRISIQSKSGTVDFVEGGNIPSYAPGYKLPSRPAYPIKEDVVRPDSPNWSDEPMLKGTLSLKSLEGKDFVSATDILIALARDRGLSVVCEDFCSHRAGSNRRDQLQDKWLSEGMPTSNIRGLMNNDLIADWDCSKDLLVTHSDAWQKRAQNLVPESLLNDIIAKLNGAGVGLDDLVSLAYLTQDQSHEWLALSREIILLKPTGTLLVDASASTLRWYDSLIPQQTAELSGESGLQLSSADLQRLINSRDVIFSSRLQANLRDKTDCTVFLKKRPAENGISCSYHLAFYCPGIGLGGEWAGPLAVLPSYSKARAEELLKLQKTATPTPSSPSQ